MNITIKDIIKICDAKLIYGNEEFECTDFSKDTRTIKDGDVYIGIKGENFDGNKLYKEAFEKGASVCIVQNINIEENEYEKYKNKNLIVVEDTIEALQKIAKYKRELYKIPVIAVTGSVGKTSTKDIIASVVGVKYNVLKTQGNLNNHIGLPLTILGLKEHNALVVEMGMNNLGEISTLSKIAKPNIAVITNVGTAHIGNLGSRENILKAKLEILDGMDENGVLIINNDNDMLQSWNCSNKKINVITYGIENNSNVKAININLQESASSFDVEYNINNSKVSIENVIVPIGGTKQRFNRGASQFAGCCVKIRIRGVTLFFTTKKLLLLETAVVVNNLAQLCLNLVTYTIDRKVSLFSGKTFNCVHQCNFIQSFKARRQTG